MSNKAEEAGVEEYEGAKKNTGPRQLPTTCASPALLNRNEAALVTMMNQNHRLKSGSWLMDRSDIGHANGGLPAVSPSEPP